MRRLGILVATLVLAGCSKTLVPRERTSIFSQDKAPDLIGVCLRPPEGITGFWTPEEKDLKGAEDGLEDYLLSASSGVRNPRKELPAWQQYYRQVAGVVKNGERLLFVSYAFFPLMRDSSFVARQKLELEQAGRTYDPDWWRSQVLSVNDGGSAFFRVLYDPKKKKFIWYDQNGHA